jgi:2-polyprenyl-6-methoxyphenol hydroxylase-like FAD-dependent oxidoreductase
MEQAYATNVRLKPAGKAMDGVPCEYGTRGKAVRDFVTDVQGIHPKTDACSRHGYPMIFIDRRHLLQILYDNLESKEKVLTGKRVEEVLTAVNGVLIKLKGGETIAGDILIGADGVHSTVRKEMWRLASKSRPGYFPENEQSSESQMLAMAVHQEMLIPK